MMLGLLFSNANTTFSRLGMEVTTLSADILRLDHILREYGADAEPSRKMLLRNDMATFELHQRMLDMLLVLTPTNPRDQWRRDQALTLVARIGDTRWLLAAQEVGQGTPKEFVALLVFWLFLLFASFGLFAPRDLTSAPS